MTSSLTSSNTNLCQPNTVWTTAPRNVNLCQAYPANQVVPQKVKTEVQFSGSGDSFQRQPKNTPKKVTQSLMRRLFSDDYLKEALETFGALKNNDFDDPYFREYGLNRFRNTVTALQARLESLAQQELNLSYEDSTVERNKIRFAAMNLIQHVPESHKKNRLSFLA